MEIKEIPTLEQKQAFWAEQLPNFEAKYWLPDHFDFLVFDMDQGNYVINDDLDPSFEDDATEIWHRVNTGWAMWKKAIKFTEQQATPEGFVLNSPARVGGTVFNENIQWKTVIECAQRHFENLKDDIKPIVSPADMLKIATGELVLMPTEPTKAIKTALSYQCFDFIAVAQAYRNLGFDIPKKAEDEQSFFLHKFLILAIKHGNDFIKVFNAETKAMIEAKEQK